MFNNFSLKHMLILTVFATASATFLTNIIGLSVNFQPDGVHLHLARQALDAGVEKSVQIKPSPVIEAFLTHRMGADTMIVGFSYGSVTNETFKSKEGSVGEFVREVNDASMDYSGLEVEKVEIDEQAVNNNDKPLLILHFKEQQIDDTQEETPKVDEKKPGMINHQVKDEQTVTEDTETNTSDDFTMDIDEQIDANGNKQGNGSVTAANHFDSTAQNSEENIHTDIFKGDNWQYDKTVAKKTANDKKQDSTNDKHFTIARTPEGVVEEENLKSVNTKVDVSRENLTEHEKFVDIDEENGTVEADVTRSIVRTVTVEEVESVVVSKKHVRPKSKQSLI